MKREVRVKIDGATGADFTVAGRTIATNVQPGSDLSGEGANVDVEVSNLEGGTYEVTGQDVLRFADQVAEPLDELTDLLSKNLDRQDQIEDLQEIVTQLKEQVEKPGSSRNLSKIKRLLNGLDHCGVNP
jgi:hypothetical protein